MNEFRKNENVGKINRKKEKINIKERKSPKNEKMEKSKKIRKAKKIPKNMINLSKKNPSNW